MSKTVKRTGGGHWNPEEKNLYFVASGSDALQVAGPIHDQILIAVNELKENDITIFQELANAGCNVFLDSGIFNLTNEHKRAHGVSMNEALSLAPNEIDGFDELLSKYLKVVHQLEPHLWGYIELDQGGCDNKRKTRAMLESEGLRPIPVYHPLNDGWDYFDELAEQYDRICFGNIVQASRLERQYLVATAYERRKKHPGLWIHLLGYTPDAITNTYPSSSCDSSSWLSGVRWGGNAQQIKACGISVGTAGEKFTYRRDEERGEDSLRYKSIKAGAYDASFIQVNWRQYLSEMSHEGLSV